MVGYSKMVKCGCEGTTRLEGRLVGVCLSNLVANYHMYFMKINLMTSS